MSNWDRSEQFAQRAESSSQWLKFTGDGDRAVVIFLGEPHPREVVFEDGGYQPFTKEHEARGVKPTYRFPMNVAVLPDFDVKVLELGVGLFRDVLKVRNKYGLEGWAYEITRRGAAKDPKTTYDLLPERQLADDERRRCANLKLHDLIALYEGRGVAANSESQPTPIDDATARDLVEKLKALPRPAVDEWLHEMRITRVRELTTNQVAAARELMRQLADHAKQQPADPFA